METLRVVGELFVGSVIFGFGFSIGQLVYNVVVFYVF